MGDGFSIVCPACGEARDISLGLTPNVDGELLCANCGSEIPIPLAAPDESQGDSSTSPADLPTIVNPQHQVHPAGADSIESMLGDCGSGRYDEQETIGKGGMGEIVLCVEQNVRREVAMKRLLPTAAKHARQRARFVQEAQVTGQLEHPNIVPIHELGRDARGAIYFTMKLVKGRSLGEILTAARDGEETHSLGEMLGIFLKVCDGVAFAHSRGVVHRDLKPANIMVGDFGEVLVMDWGIARILPLRPPGYAGQVGRDEIADETDVQSSRQDTDLPALHTIAGAVMGSPQYMPPEQAAGEIDKIDHRSDIYALGAILYEILTLKRPFDGGDARATIDEVIKGNIHPPEQRAPERDIPRELSAVAMKCLAKYRGKRYASVPDLQRDVRLYLEGRSVSAAPDTFAQALVKLIKRNKPVSLAVAAAAVILIALTVVFVVRLKSERDSAVASEHKAVTAQQQQRATALAASEQLARQAVRAAGEGRFAEADARADAAVKIMPDGPWGHYALGVVAFEKQDFVGARRHLEKATSLDPSHRPSRLFLASILATSGDLAKWEKLVAQADQATDWRSLVAAGDALMGAERHPQARKAYQRATDLVARGAAVPANVRIEVNDKLARATACVKMAGFHESIRNLPAREQARRLEDKLREIYGPKLRVSITIEEGSLPSIVIEGNGDLVRWLDPLRGLLLRELDCRRANVADLSPLRGMPLKNLDICLTRVTDLTPLKDMPLTDLILSNTDVTDLTPLKGMHLEKLLMPFTKVKDLGPLKGMPLKELSFSYTEVTDLGPLKGMKLTSLDLDECRALRGDLSPLEGMPLTKLNLCRCFTIRGDLSALKGMKLTSLTLIACLALRGDLSALEGMPLTELNLRDSRGLRGDLSPLGGMPLTKLNVQALNVSDLSPLKGMPLQHLQLRGTPVSDLTSLKGIKLTDLRLADCPSVTSLRGIEGMPLTYLNICHTRVSDLRLLKGMPLRYLHVDDTKVTDLTPLAGMKLEKFAFTPKNITKGIEIIRGMKTISDIGTEWDQHAPGPGMDPEEFWKKYDAGEFK